MYELQIFLEQSVISLYIFFYKKQYTSLFIQMGNIFSTFIKQTFCWKRLAFFSYISHTTWKRTNDNIKITFFLQKLRCRNNLDGEKWVKRFNYPFFTVLFCFFFFGFLELKAVLLWEYYDFLLCETITLIFLPFHPVCECSTAAKFIW